MKLRFTVLLVFLAACTASNSPVATEGIPLDPAVPHAKGEDALRTLLSRRHYKPTKSDIEHVSDNSEADLRRLAQSDRGSQMVQLRAIWSLSLYPSEAAIEALLLLLASERAVIRRNSLAALGRIEDDTLLTSDTVATALVPTIGDSDVQVRLAAVKLLIRIPSGPAVLSQALKDETDVTVRRRIEKFLAAQSGEVLR